MSLPPTIKKQILVHSVDSYPNECCGLIIVVKGRKRYRPCKNLQKLLDEHFIIDPLDYAAAEDLGEVVAVVHFTPEVKPGAITG